MVSNDQKKQEGINLIPLINTFWRLKSKINQLNISEQQMKPLKTYMNAILDILNGFGYEVVDYTNKKYNFGDNVDVLSVEGEGDGCRIIECLQPTIIVQNDIQQKATVIIKRG